MNKEALFALRASIKHWRRMRKWAPLPNEKPGSVYCPLCQTYLGPFLCRGCPVYEKTELNTCKGTPYYIAHERHSAYEKAIHNPDSTKRGIAQARKLWRAAATKEIIFLESLLPPKRKSPQSKSFTSRDEND